MLWHMRTTIRLPDALYREVRNRAGAERRTVTSFIEEALRQRLASRTPRDEGAFVVEPFVGTGALPGVDVTNSASLLDAMDR
jgi:hypothetical protein